VPERLSVFKFQVTDPSRGNLLIDFLVHLPVWEGQEAVCRIVSADLPDNCEIRGLDLLQALELGVGFCRIFCSQRGYIWPNGELVFSDMPSEQAD
jgi:hypothetical protein